MIASQNQNQHFFAVAFKFKMMVSIRDYLLSFLQNSMYKKCKQEVYIQLVCDIFKIPSRMFEGVPSLSVEGWCNREFLLLLFFICNMTAGRLWIPSPYIAVPAQTIS